MRKINSQLPVAAGRVLLRHLEAHFPAISLIPFPSVPLSSLRRHRHTRHTFITNQDNQFFTTGGSYDPSSFRCRLRVAASAHPSHNTNAVALLASVVFSSPMTRPRVGSDGKIGSVVNGERGRQHVHFASLPPPVGGTTQIPLLSPRVAIAAVAVILPISISPCYWGGARRY